MVEGKKRRTPLNAQIEELKLLVDEQGRQLTKLREHIGEANHFVLRIESAHICRKGYRVDIAIMKALAEVESKPTASVAPLQRAVWLANWLPGSGLRKKVRKLVADEQHDIIEMRKANQLGCARWQVGCVYVLVAWYAIKYPFAAVVLALIKRIHTAG
jgi:hypothetical protein